MKTFAAISTSVLASVAYAQQSGPPCNAVSYDMSGFSGTLNYKTVTKYDFSMASCSMQDATVKSPIAPLDQGLTAVFRGPIHLKQFAVYNQAPGSKKRSAKASPRERRHHNHERFHKRNAEADAEVEAVDIEKRGCGDPVVATFDGVPQTMYNTWGPCAGAAAAATPAASAPAVNVNVAAAATTSAAAANSAKSTQAAASSATPSSSPSSSSSGSGSGSGSSSGGAWNQVAYYSAESKKADNVTFLFPVPYANTDFLPANGDCTGKAASSAQVLEDVLVQDNQHFYVASGSQMSDSAAPENKAYHGFSGNKIFLVEMGMPASGLRGQGSYPDMPAFWLLNEQLPATSDASQCSCWASGCGEFDIHEILSAGGTVGYSTLHMGQNYCGGASNGFSRPTSGTQKLAVILNSDDKVVKINVLDNSYNFGNSISESDYNSWVNTAIAGGQKGSIQTGSACPDPSKLTYRSDLRAMI